MPAEYHHLAPVILTQDMYETYRPELTVNPSDQQYQFAFLMAEQAMIRGLKTPLQPVQISGSFGFPDPYQVMTLPHTYVRSVDSIVAYALAGGCNCDMVDVDACAVVRNYHGYIDTRVIAGYYVNRCGCAPSRPHHYDITYTAGLYTGTSANDASLHMSLCMLAQIELLEMLDPGALEGGAGDAGVESYSTLGYTEKRTEASVRETPFGTSALANKAWRLVKHLYIPRALKMG